jgi:hypothetical protein
MSGYLDPCQTNKFLSLAGFQMNEIKGIARIKFFPGKVEEWKRLTEQALEIVRTRDTGTLQYEVFFNADESEIAVLACPPDKLRASSCSTLPRLRRRARAFRQMKRAAMPGAWRNAH